MRASRNAKALKTRKRPLVVLIPLRLPGNGRRRLRLPVLRCFVASGHSHDNVIDPKRSQESAMTVLLKSLITILVCLAPAVCLLVFALKHKRSTLVISPTQVARIYAWEMAAGRHPSYGMPNKRLLRGTIASALDKLENPGLPQRANRGSTAASGHERQYLSLPTFQHGGWPPRPSNDATLDLDIVMEHCDFGRGKYVRDCLERLRVNAGLQHQSAKRGSSDPWRMHFRTTGDTRVERRAFPNESPKKLLEASVATFRSALYSRQQHTKSYPPLEPDIMAIAHPSHPTADSICDPDNPRLFHMFWTGDFTDKPYIAALSFLYTQNLGLNQSSSTRSRNCRPQLWIWINPGPTSSVPYPHAQEELKEAMQRNRWSAPLLHPRFSEHIKFRLWNMTEQLDGVERMEGWRSKPLFQSHGKKFKKSIQQGFQDHDRATVRSSDAKSYDRLSVVLSDMARFVLTFRFGGVYVDADTIFLRDWTELFNWRGAFAYRWSRLPLYNTAVLKMQRGSMTGDWLFKTAVANGNDFHPMTLSRYTKDAGMDSLIMRLPDALFDPPWLNVENYQRDRPAFPSFKSFDDFFDQTTNELEPGLPGTLGFDHFFRGAFSYHWHNFWWKPFDPDRNYPDLGQRFVDTNVPLRRSSEAVQGDLSWSQVLKRTFESFVRGDNPNMYGEWIDYEAAG
ncbi:hypothetical protein OIV83_006465 [Microbotryomycetes sp. JL201]|nr:hypothetical protein OIV83_006465 [Microbotryomycetes sp. JL201]